MNLISDTPIATLERSRAERASDELLTRLTLRRRLARVEKERAARSMRLGMARFMAAMLGERL